MSYQSYRQCFVTNSPTLLAQGKTVDSLAVGQVGFLDAKTLTAVSLPTYAKNKALLAVWGTPDVNLGDFGGVPNENEYSKVIKGKKIKRIRAKKAQRGQTPLWTVGWSGDLADSDTLFASAGESKSLFIKLTGTVIDRLYSTQGFTKQFVFVPKCTTDCDELCTAVDPRDISEQLVKLINEDKDLSKFIKAKELVTCSNAIPPTKTTCYKFKVVVCDTGDDLALGLIQAQYPDDEVSRISRSGSFSTYEIVRLVNTTPAAYAASNTFVSECATCPVGGTLVESAFVYTVEVRHGVNVEEITDFASVVLLHSEGGRDTYTVVSEDKITAADLPEGADFTLIGETRDVCVLGPTNYTWTTNGTMLRQSRNFRITLADTICGTERLTELQEAYPQYVITAVSKGGGTCVHTYNAVVYSDCYEAGCAIDALVFKAPAPFEGAIWEEQIPARSGSNCKTGIQIETAFFNRATNECTFDAFPYENDIVYVQMSNYNPDFNDSPCEWEWSVKQIRSAKFPAGHGAYVRKQEEKSKSYDRRTRSSDPVVREVQGYSFQADPNKFYDEYTIEFDFDYNTSGGWTEKYTDQYSLSIYIPEGTGDALENLLNSYATSTGIDEDSVAI